MSGGLECFENDSIGDCVLVRAMAARTPVEMLIGFKTEQSPSSTLVQN